MLSVYHWLFPQGSFGKSQLTSFSTIHGLLSHICKAPSGEWFPWKQGPFNSSWVLRSPSNRHPVGSHLAWIESMNTKTNPQGYGDPKKWSLTLPHTLCCWVLKANRELFQTKIEWTERAQSRRIWAKARVATGLGKTSCFMWLKYWWLRGKRWSSRAKLKPNQESLCVIIRHLDWLLQAKASNRELFIRKMRDIYFTKVNDSPH